VKAKLFHDAQIFVFPSRYPVEAQPITLIEAMAAGCAIITSKVGEISSLVDETCAVMLEEVTAVAVASAIERLALSPELRRDLAIAARARFASLFCPERHYQDWHSLLCHVVDGK
jgi:glycosyltransferase involved in cell wall biosynthesis